MTRPRQLRELGLEPVDLGTTPHQLVRDLRVAHEARIDRDARRTRQRCDHGNLLSHARRTSGDRLMWVLRLRWTEHMRKYGNTTKRAFGSQRIPQQIRARCTAADGVSEGRDSAGA